MLMGDAIFSLMLIAACCYTMYALTPADNPYGYVAAAFCLVHGMLSLVRSFEESEECGRAYLISSSILEVIPLPLVNIEFYLKSDQSALALVHGLSLIPLFYDVLGKMGDDMDSNTDTLKDIALLGNIASTTYLAAKDGNPLYGGVAFSAFVARYCPTLVDHFIPGIGGHVNTLGNATILALMTYALTQG